MTKAEVFKKAIEILQTKGWCQRKFCDEQGRCCMVGAVNKACGHAAFGPAYCSHKYNELMAELGPYALSWNDAPGRTFEEVIGALQAAEEST